MKKLLIVMFTLFSTLGLASCGESKETVTNEENEVTMDTLDVEVDSVLPEVEIPVDSL